jgi:hypothetical protein
MVSDKTDEAFAIGGRHGFACVDQPFGKSVDPNPAIGFSITSTTAWTPIRSRPHSPAAAMPAVFTAWSS